MTPSYFSVQQGETRGQREATISTTIALIITANDLREIIGGEKKNGETLYIRKGKYKGAFS